MCKRSVDIWGHLYHVLSVNSLIVKRLKWQVLEERRDYFLACIMYKCFHGYAPLRLCNAIDMAFERHPMNTRLANSMSVVLPKPNIDIFKNSLRYEGGKVWNNLPSNLQNEQSIDCFKNMCIKKTYFSKL